MRFFATSKPPLGGGDASGGDSHPARTTSAPANCPPPHKPSPLAAATRPKQKPRTTPKKRRIGTKNAVHPIDLRDLESELDLLRDSPRVNRDNNKAAGDPSVSACVAARGYTVVVSALHALDLYNPCQMRSCPHAFVPLVRVAINDTPPQDLVSARHAKNYTSWFPPGSVQSQHASPSTNAMYIVRVTVAAHCTRHAKSPETVPIGAIDEILFLPLSLETPSNVAMFYPVFRHCVIGGRQIKYPAGKVKLRISLVPDKPIASSKDPLPVVVEPPLLQPIAPSPSTAGIAVVRPAFLLDEALQLKRKQLKATVMPETTAVRLPLEAAEEDQTQARVFLDALSRQVGAHIVQERDFLVLEQIGQGVHATVFHARDSDTRRHSSDADVAMKEFRYNRRQESTETTEANCRPPPLGVLRAFQQEYEMLLRVTESLDLEGNTSTVINPIIQLVGVILPPRLSIVTEYCSDGSLATCMQDTARWSQIPFTTKLVLGGQIASSLAYLHRLQIVHRDIKPHNIMVHGLFQTTDVSSTPIAKIGDLGSAVVHNRQGMLHEETGSSGYTAPEVFSSSGYDHRVDIWSVGVVLWELLTTDIPTQNGSQKKKKNPFMGICGEEVLRKAEQGEKPAMPETWDPRVVPPWCAILLARCWHMDKTQRPSASEIASAFQIAISSF